MICPQCGTERADLEQFCANCGYTLQSQQAGQQWYSQQQHQQPPYPPQPGETGVGQVFDLSAVTAHVMTRVYMYMFVGLLVTAITALITVTNEAWVSMILENVLVFYGLMVVELILVAVLARRIRKMSFGVAFFIFMLYSFLNGLTLSVVFLVYTESSIVSAFLVTALTFGIMSVIGYTTKKDLTTLGRFCIMALIGLIIAWIVNIFIMNNMMSFILSVIGLLIFIGLTAYDTQKIKRDLAGETDALNIQRISICGALSLYLDFINIFLNLLRIMGSRR